jgi:hypothetical protein
MSVRLSFQRGVVDKRVVLFDVEKSEVLTHVSIADVPEASTYAVSATVNDTLVYLCVNKAPFGGRAKEIVRWRYKNMPSEGGILHVSLWKQRETLPYHSTYSGNLEEFIKKYHLTCVSSFRTTLKKYPANL